MIVNLTKIEEYIITLEIDKADQMSLRHSGVRRQHMKDLSVFLKEIRKDLELSGESIIELDKRRVDAINERNKKYKFIHVK